MKEKNIITILSCVCIVLFISVIALIFDRPEQEIRNMQFTGGYTLNTDSTKVSGLIISIDEDKNKFYYYDQMNELSTIKSAQGSIKKLDAQTLIFESEELNDPIVFLTNDGIKFVYSFDKSIKTLDIKKASESIGTIDNFTE